MATLPNHKHPSMWFSSFPPQASLAAPVAEQETEHDDPQDCEDEEQSEVRGIK